MNFGLHLLQFFSELRFDQVIAGVGFTGVVRLRSKLTICLQTAERCEVLIEGALQIHEQVSATEPHFLHGLSGRKTFEGSLKADEWANDSVAEFQQVPQHDWQNGRRAEPHRMVLADELTVEIRERARFRTGQDRSSVFGVAMEEHRHPEHPVVQHPVQSSADQQAALNLAIHEQVFAGIGLRRWHVDSPKVDVSINVAHAARTDLALPHGR